MVWEIGCRWDEEEDAGFGMRGAGRMSDALSLPPRILAAEVTQIGVNTMNNHSNQIETRLLEAFDALWDDFVDPREAYADAADGWWMPRWWKQTLPLWAGWLITSVLSIFR
jgi:hypothetical protein